MEHSGQRTAQRAHRAPVGRGVHAGHAGLREQEISLADHDFSSVLVDPPRAGVDDATLALLQRFPNIVYISCNPHTLRANLDTLCQTHTIQRMALFDQFPFTPHTECGVLLRQKQAGADGR